MRHLFTLFLSAVLLATPALAVTISNCDDIPRNVTINNAGEIREHTLPAGRSIESYGTMISARTEGSEFIRIQARDIYCIRKGVLSLQTRRPYNTNQR